MSLDKYSAKSYNNQRGYSQQATAIIQNFVGAATSGIFDDPTVQAIYNMQKSPLYGFKFAADGKVGPNTLGFIILELENVLRMSDAAVLKNYTYTIQGSSGEVNPVVSFMQWTAQPLKLRTDGFSSYSIWGVFSVSVKFTNVDPKRYEYRQRIKGFAWSRLPDKSWEDSKDAFQVPADKNYPLKGLHKNQWKEDGQITGINKSEQFGYRNRPAKFGQGVCDYYPSDAEYLMQDTFGFAENKNYVKGAKFQISVDYAGCIIDKQKPAHPMNDIFTHKEVFSKQWSYYYETALP